MSNLGNYQKMTTVSKALGGPPFFMFVTAVAGLSLGAITNICIDVYKKISKKISCNSDDECCLVFEVKTVIKTSEGIKVNPGSKIRILESVEDALMIEVIGTDNNPQWIKAADLSKAIVI